jgi:hypothetical protein
MIAPDLRNLAAMAESETGFASIKAYDPAGPLLVMFHLSMQRHPTIRLHLVIGSDIILDQNWEAMERSQRNRQVSRPLTYSRHKTYQCLYVPSQDSIFSLVVQVPGNFPGIRINFNNGADGGIDLFVALDVCLGCFSS